MGIILFTTHRINSGMKIKFLICLYCLLCLFASSANSQDTSEYFNPAFLRYENHIYIPSIKTVILEKAGTPLSAPVIQLNSDEKLQLSFDELDADIRDFSYRWIHCDANWQPSSLSESDYIDGFFTDHIVNFKHSFNTFQEFYHYSLEFPNAQMRPTVSGNYLLVVFENSEPDFPLITYRFWVIENLCEIQPNIHRATDIAVRNSHQEVDFKILTGSLKVVNPYSDIKVSVVQNNRWDAAITNLKPLFVLDGTLDYNYEDGNLFEGGSEFRNFDLRSVRFLTQFTESIEQDNITHLYSVFLKPDLRKSTQRYAHDDDINGKFLIKVYEGRDGNLEGDYVKVKFRLPVLEEADSGNIYLFGQFTNWNIVPWARMIFNDETSSYEQTIVLKQGYYNYEYLLLPVNSACGRIAETEGNHFETANSYSFYVYWRELGARYDRLVGYRIAE
jgi:hypothetical protein